MTRRCWIHAQGVRGVSNLRGVDASSFPFLPPGHPQSVIYALAEKIAADSMGWDSTIGRGYAMDGYIQEQGLASKARRSSGGSSGEEEYDMGIPLSSLRSVVVLVIAIAVSAISASVW